MVNLCRSQCSVIGTPFTKAIYLKIPLHVIWYQQSGIRIDMSKHRKPRWERRVTPAEAADYLAGLEWWIEKYGKPDVIIYCRVSGRNQYYKRNMILQTKIIRQLCRHKHLHVVYEFHEIASGTIRDKENRLAFIQAVEIARQQSTETAILAVTPDRFLRSEDYTSVNPVLPSKEDWETLRSWASGVPLLTVLNPDMTEKQIHSQRVKWGMKIKGQKGGRPKKRKAVPGQLKKRRDEMLPKVKKLLKRGKTVYRINKMTGIACSTIRDWLRKDAKE